jgi:hypothetical protein
MILTLLPAWLPARIRAWATRLRFFLRTRPSADHAQLDEELWFHLERSVQEKLALGITLREAQRQARIEFGGVEQAREEAWRQRAGWLLESMAQDVRYALRGFRRNPILVVTVLVTLALGIGATTAVFSVVDRILFRSLPYADADRLVSIGLVQSLEKQEFMVGGFFYEWRDHQKPFVAMASQGTNPHACNLVESNPLQLNCLPFQAGFLPLLGITPVLGRFPRRIVRAGRGSR